MGQGCSSCSSAPLEQVELSRADSPDPVMYDLMRKSLLATSSQSPKRNFLGQHHLLYKNHSKNHQNGTAANNTTESAIDHSSPPPCPTRLLVRRKSTRLDEDGVQIYAIRYPEETKDLFVSEQAIPRMHDRMQEQCPPRNRTSSQRNTRKKRWRPSDGEYFTSSSMKETPSQEVVDWVTVSEEHHIYIADVGLTAGDCDELVTATEQVCRGQYAAYTYAKQTLGCREYPTLVQPSFAPVHTTVHAINQNFPASRHLQLDDREPHIVKYDITKKERQKLDMHTDKSEWTFLIALSNGCGVDYEGGGTYFECLDATVHLQRGHALIFPGKLRHCGMKISRGLRFLLVGFLVDKTAPKSKASISMQSHPVKITIEDSSEELSDSESSGSNEDDDDKTPPEPPGTAPF